MDITLKLRTEGLPKCKCCKVQGLVREENIQTDVQLSSMGGYITSEWFGVKNFGESTKPIYGRRVRCRCCGAIYDVIEKEVK